MAGGISGVWGFWGILWKPKENLTISDLLFTFSFVLSCFPISFIPLPYLFIKIETWSKFTSSHIKIMSSKNLLQVLADQ